MVKVSIGVPVYNVEAYLRECLDSIMNQTFKDFEVIMVDDGSTDNSFDICQEYVARDNRFKLFHQENKGIAGARNTCLKYMKGEYINWVDSDDKVEPNYLERLLEVQAETQADSVNSMYYRLNEHGWKEYYDFRYISTDLSAITLNKADILETTLNNKYQLVILWGNLERRELYKGVYFPQGTSYEDEGTKFKLFLKARKIVLLPEALYGYRKRTDSIINKKFMSLSEQIKMVGDHQLHAEKLLYYLDIYQKIEIDKFRNIYLSNLDYFSNNNDLNEEDKIKFQAYIRAYQQKLRRSWGKE